MIESSKIAQIINSSPSVDILKLHNREIIITFLVWKSSDIFIILKEYMAE
jgi:hypothetical protein